MRKMVAKNGQMHWFGTALGLLTIFKLKVNFCFLGSSLPSTSKTITRPKQSQIVLRKSSSKMPSTSQNEYRLDDEFVEEEIIVDDRDVNIIQQQQPRHFSADDPSLLVYFRKLENI